MSRRPARSCLATRPRSFRVSNSGRCAIFRCLKSGRTHRPSRRFAAPTGCRSLAAPVPNSARISAAADARRICLTGDARATDPVCHLSPQHDEVARIAAIQIEEYEYRRLSARAGSTHPDCQSGREVYDTGCKASGVTGSASSRAANSREASHAIFDLAPIVAVGVVRVRRLQPFGTSADESDRPYQPGGEQAGYQSEGHAIPPTVTPVDKIPVDKIKLPAGFKAEIWSSGHPGGRTMVMGPKGTMFIGSRIIGRVYAITEKDGKREAKVMLQGLTHAERARDQGRRALCARDQQGAALRQYRRQARQSWRAAST